MQLYCIRLINTIPLSSNSRPTPPLFALLSLCATILRIEIPLADLSKLFSPFAVSLPEGGSLPPAAVLLHLVGNAIKFTHCGEIEVSATLLSGDRKEGGALTDTIQQQIQFSVRDTGIGIASKYQTHIFNRFTQAESDSTRNYEGTGLGLTIASMQRMISGVGLTVQAVGDPESGCRALTAACDHKTPFDILLIDAQMHLTENFKTQLQAHRQLTDHSHKRFPLITHLYQKHPISHGQGVVDGYFIKPLRRNELLEAIAQVTGKSFHYEIMPKTPAAIDGQRLVPLRILLVEDNINSTLSHIQNRRKYDVIH
jgi:CheY-like chemotaxis protein